MQIEEFESTLQIVRSLSKGGRKYMEMCDKVRVAASPLNSFPGFMDKLKSPTLIATCQILQEFSQIIFENKEKYTQSHLSRSIDSLSNAALGYSILYIKTHNNDFFIRCCECIKKSINFCRDFSPKDIQNSLSFIFNISCYIFAAKEYSGAYKLFRIIIIVISEIKSKCFQRLQAKTFKRIAMCLIAFDKQDTNEFDEAIRNCDNNETVIHNLICLHPSTNPELVSSYISSNFRSALNSMQNDYDDSNLTNSIDPKNLRLYELFAYFTLHGYFTYVPKKSEFYLIFPNMTAPTKIPFQNPKIKQKYLLCNSLFSASRFVECNNESVSLLKSFPTKKLTPSSYVSLLFVYFWIIESYIALDKNVEARWYSKEMRKIFKSYPFTVGFAAFLELKSRIHIAKFKRMKPFPKITFKSNFNWSSVISLENAILCVSDGSEECFMHFHAVAESGNPMVKCESFHYYATACRFFGIYPDIANFKSVCRLNKPSSALYIYHSAVQALMSEDVEDFWDPKNYINGNPKMEKSSSDRCQFLSVQKILLDELKKAEKLASGYPVIARKILQLEALITGTSDVVSAAFLLTTSLSQSLDRFIPSAKQKKFLIPFPILSIAYFDVVGLDQCLLFALYHPNSKPIVVRVACGSSFARCLDMLEEIEQESTDVSSSLPPAEWWAKKKSLDDRLGGVINEIERILGPWSGLLSPMIFKPHHSLAANTLITSLISNQGLNDQIVEIMEKMGLFMVQPYQKPKVISNDNSSTRTEIFMSSSSDSGLSANSNSCSEGDLNINDEPRQSMSANPNSAKRIDTSAYKCVEKLPLALILGKTVHRVPWESLPIVLKNEVPITRIPSLRLVALHCSEAKLPVDVDTNNAFFVLNPQGDLVTTQMTFNDVFVKEYEWEGLSGVPPEKGEVLEAIARYDLFVYCGHGSGREYFDYGDIANMGVKCRSSMLLMGCRSAELKDEGDSDPRGVPMSLVAAGACAVVGNLWNVTDRDIDRFLLDLLNRTVEKGPNELEVAVLHARSACKLKYLTGAAPIIYGFPTFFYNNESKHRQSFGLSSILNNS